MDEHLGIEAIGDVFQMIKPAKAKWEKIGKALGMQEDTLQSIASKKEGLPDQCLYTTLNAWLHNRGKLRYGNNSWKLLIRMLESKEIGEPELAQAIMKQKGLENPMQSVVHKPQYSEPKEEDFRDTCHIQLDEQDLRWLQHNLVDVESEWHNFGLNLGIKYGHLKTIEKDCHYKCKDCLRETLVCWLTKSTATLQQLLVALNRSEEQHLIDQIKQSIIANEHRKGLFMISADSLPAESALECYLRGFYCNRESSQPDETSWLPTLDVEYINLQLISQNEFPDISELKKKVTLSKQGKIDEIIKESRPIDILDIANYNSRSRKVIFIEGVAGVGKTTIAYKLCENWACKKQFNEFRIVLYIPLRVPYFRVAETPPKLLQYFESHCSPSDIDQILKSQGKGVLFVLDGWDELRPSCRDVYSFFPKFIRGECLPESSIIVTSRPGSIDPSLKKHANRLVEILGFTEEQVNQYILSCFKKYDGKGQKLIQDLQAYPNVASTCYVAINLTIVCYVYLVSSFNLPTTLTEVYEQFVIHAVKRHFRKLPDDDTDKALSSDIYDAKTLSGFSGKAGMVLRALGNLALSGLTNGDLTFTKDELLAYYNDSNPNKFDGYGLLKILLVYRKSGIERCYYFLHSTVQEYLAAYMVFQMDKDHQGKWMQEHLTNPLYGMVFRFFCGMDRFKSIPARVLLCGKNNFISTKFVAECIFEAQWEEGCQKIARNTTSLIFTNRDRIEPYRALVYGYLMAKSKSQWQLCWVNCTIGERELYTMNFYLLEAPRALSQISLVQASFRNQHAAQLFSNILQSQDQLLKLTFDRTHLNDDFLHCICDKLHRHKSLQILNLNKNCLTSSCVNTITNLLASLPVLHTLDLRGNDLDEDSCRNIISIASKQESLKQLYLPCKTDCLVKEVKKLTIKVILDTNL